MKTQDLIKRALDWAVAISNGLTAIMLHDLMRFRAAETNYMGDLTWHLKVQDNIPWIPNNNGIGGNPVPLYSDDWAQGGPIIEREKISLVQDNILKVWRAHDPKQQFVGRGSTPLIAAMRCYVASKLGDEVKIPKELL